MLNFERNCENIPLQIQLSSSISKKCVFPIKILNNLDLKLLETFKYVENFLTL